MSVYPRHCLYIQDYAVGGRHAACSLTKTKKPDGQNNRSRHTALLLSCEMLQPLERGSSRARMSEALCCDMPSNTGLLNYSYLQAGDGDPNNEGRDASRNPQISPQRGCWGGGGGSGILFSSDVLRTSYNDHVHSVRCRCLFLQIKTPHFHLKLPK